MTVRALVLGVSLLALGGCGGDTKECQALYSAGNAVSAAYLEVEDLARDPDEQKFKAAKEAFDAKVSALAAVPSSSSSLKVKGARARTDNVAKHAQALIAHLEAERPSLLADPNKKLGWGELDGPVSKAKQSFSASTKTPQLCE
jgi:hypothetical protein